MMGNPNDPNSLCETCHWRWSAADTASPLSQKGYVYCETLAKVVRAEARQECYWWTPMGPPIPPDAPGLLY